MVTIQYIQKKKILEELTSQSKADSQFFIMVLLSCTVATYGLLSNSNAVIIGAMLISPLMGPIIGGALGVSTRNNALLKISLKAEIFGAAAAIMLAVLLTLFLPVKTTTIEILSRTRPTLIDLVIALASGCAGSYAICTSSKGATLPGVAISTALMPPLCVVGIGLALQDFRMAFGSFLLFIANTVAINFAAIVIFELFDLEEGVKPSLFKKIFYPLIMLIAVAVPLLFFMYNSFQNSKIENMIRTIFEEDLEVLSQNSKLLSLEYVKKGNVFIIDAMIRTTDLWNPTQIRQLENHLEYELKHPVSINADMILVQKLNNERITDNFQKLLPEKEKIKQIKVVQTITPEELIEKTLLEKLALFKNSKLEDFSFTYKKATGTYIIHALISSPSQLDKEFTSIVQILLENLLKRRVEIYIEQIGAPEVEKTSFLFLSFISIFDT